MKKKRNHKKSVHTVSACNPKKYTTFPVLFLGFRYRIHDRRWKPLSGAWNCQSNRRCASSWVTGFIHPLLNRLGDVIIIINIYDKRILFIVQWITCHNAFFLFSCGWIENLFAYIMYMRSCSYRNPKSNIRTFVNK